MDRNIEMDEDDKRKEKDMIKALIMAKSVWRRAGMPEIIDNRSAETGKIALAILACKIYGK